MLLVPAEHITVAYWLRLGSLRSRFWGWKLVCRCCVGGVLLEKTPVKVRKPNPAEGGVML